MSQPLQPGQRDPRQPFGRPQATPVSTSDYVAPRSRRPLWATLAALALLALVLGLAFRMGGDPEPATTAAPPSPSPSLPVGQAAATPAGTATPRVGVLREVPFTNPSDGTSGSFEVVSHQWIDQGLLVTVRVRLDEGQQRLGFFALDNGPTASQYEPSPSGPQDLVGRTITAGETLTGTVLFDKPRGSTTVFLSSSLGKQVAALKVED